MKGEKLMLKLRTTVALAAAIVVATIAAQTLYAQDSSASRHRMMDGDPARGTMGITKMMRQMSGMMDHCSSMMHNRSTGRPNDQWRRRAPTAPDNES